MAVNSEIQANSEMPDPALLEVLRCPLTKSRLRPESTPEGGHVLVAEIGGLRYPIREGIPVMLIEEAGLPEGVATLQELKAKLNQ